jgi:uncharacterized protein involved in outer membrane biogenesis
MSAEAADVTTRWTDTRDAFRREAAKAKALLAPVHARLARLRGTTPLRHLPWFAIGFVVLALAFAAYLPFLDWNLLRGPVGQLASFELGRDIHVDGDLKVNLFSQPASLSAGDVRIANENWAGGGNVATIKRLVVEVDTHALLRGRLLLPLVQIEQPVAGFVRAPDGRENWHKDGADAGDGIALPPIQHLVIHDGTVSFTDNKHHLSFAGTVSSNDQAGGPVRGAFWLIGKGTLNRAPFLANIRGGPLLSVDLTKPYPFDADIRAGATHIVLRGTLARPFHLNVYDTQAVFSGNDLNALYDLTGLALPNTPPYSIQGHFVREGTLYRFTDFSGRLGSSDLSGDLSVEVGGARPVLRGELYSAVLAFDDLGALFGSDLPGARKKIAPAPKTQTVVLASDPTTVSRRLLPDAQLQVERVRQMDAFIHYTADTVRSRDFPLRKVMVNVALENGVLKLAPFAFGFTQGELSGNAAIDARGPVPVSDIDMRISGFKLENLIAKAAKDPRPPLEGTLEARAILHGAGNSVHEAAAHASGTLVVAIPHGKIRKAFAELMGVNFGRGLGLLLTNDRSETDLRCAVASFHAKNGVLGVDDLVFDTSVVQATGRGTIDLGTEKVDLQLDGKSKEFRLFHARAPIVIGGTLGDMTFGIKTDTALAQGGTAAAIGVFLTPLAAILPFIDAGLAKDADCLNLMLDAKSKGLPKSPG